MAGIGVIRRTRRVAVLLVAAFAALAAVGVVSAQAEPPAAGGWPWGYKLNEEFSAKGLNATLWTPEWNGAVSGSCTTPEAVEQPGDGFLHLKLLAKTSTCDGKSHQTAGGLVTSNPMDPNRKPGLKGFDYSYGYVEWGVELPVTSQPPQAPGYQITCPANGCVENWPVFWSFDQSQRTEFDVFEGLFEEKVPGTGKRVAGVGCAHFHNWDTSLGSPAYEYPALPTGTNCKASGGGFHSYGLDWEPGVQPNQGSLTWYYDGAKLGEYESVDVKSRPQFLIAEYLQTKTAYAPFILPAEAKVDYVRVWQHPIPATSTLAASEVGPTTAKLNGSVYTNGLPTSYYFEYGKTTAYGSSAPAPPGTDIGSGPGYNYAWNNLSGLEAGTTYHYRIVATNTTGTSYGVDREFATPQQPTSPSSSSWSVLDTSGHGQYLYYPNSAHEMWNWNWTPATNWGSYGLGLGGKVAAGTSPAVVRDPNTGSQYVYFVNSSNEIANWNWTPATGWGYYALGGKVAAGTSPTVVRDPNTGSQYVYFVNSNNEIANWNWTPATNWGYYALGGKVAAGTSPTVVRDPNTGSQYVYFVNGNNEIANWNWTPATNWGYYALGGKVAAGTRPTAVRDPNTGSQYVYFVNGNNEIANWNWTPATNWGYYALGGKVAAGTSPTVVRDQSKSNGSQYVYFVNSNNEIANWNWTPATNWGYYALGGKVAVGSCPTVLRDPNTGSQYVYFVNSNNEIANWNWTPATSWGYYALGGTSAPVC